MMLQSLNGDLATLLEAMKYIWNANIVKCTD